MALTTRTYAQEVGNAYAEAARGESVVEELWVSAWPDGVHMWLITQPIDLDIERHLHELTGALYSKFGKADFQLHILNPCHFRGDVHNVVPSQAEQIALAPS
jgi:hypothetical protein